MLYHVHHVSRFGRHRILKSFPQYVHAKRLASLIHLTAKERTYIAQAGLTVWDSDAAYPGTTSNTELDLLDWAKPT